MPNRRRRSNLTVGRVVVGIAAALAVSHSVAVAQLEPCPNTDPIHPYACYNQQELWDALLARTPSDSEPYEPNCQSPEGRDEADLCAQRRMAEAAEELSTLTLWQLFIGGVGLFAVAVSLLISAKATRAAENQVRLSRQALISTERAFLFVEKIKGTRLIGPDGKTAGWRFTATWHNNGKTPAIHRVSMINSGAAVGGLPANFAFEDVDPTAGQRTATGPGDRSESGPCDFQLETLEMVKRGEADAVLWGWTDYDDIFEDTPRHRTEFASHILVGGDLAAEKCSFLFRKDERFTGFDEQCRRKPRPWVPLYKDANNSN